MGKDGDKAEKAKNVGGATKSALTRTINSTRTLLEANSHRQKF